MSILGGFPRARLDVNHPDTWAVCDRCGFVHNLSSLKKQMAWRGNQLLWNGYLVCDPCLDIPFQLDRPLLLPPDPAPVLNARPNFFAQEMAGEGPSAAPDQQLLEPD